MCFELQHCKYPIRSIKRRIFIKINGHYKRRVLTDFLLHKLRFVLPVNEHHIDWRPGGNQENSQQTLVRLLIYGECQDN